MKEEDNVLSTSAAGDANDVDAVVINLEVKTHSAPPTPVHDKGLRRKKRSRSFSLLKAALNIFQDKASEKEESKKPKKKSGDWKMVVESMRPLTLQDKSPSPSLPSMSPSSSFESLAPLDVAVPDSPSVSSVSSRGGLSQYASAPNLQALDTGSDPDVAFDAIGGGDEMIDVKAEEFITQFYRQMKLQERQEF